MSDGRWITKLRLLFLKILRRKVKLMLNELCANRDGYIKPTWEINIRTNYQPCPDYFLKH